MKTVYIDKELKDATKLWELQSQVILCGFVSMNM